jgi:type IV pilus assembly protein PilB
MVVSARIDGNLQEIKRFPAGQREGVTARLKTLAGLDLGERYLPQDGRMKLTIEGKIYEIRVNLLPVALGEKLTLQLVLREEPNWSPEHIFSDPLDRRDFANLLKAPFGLIVMAGPTGSGKTTTAYTALRSLRDGGRGAIVSIEHPVGAILDGVAQIPVRPHLGLGYAEALNAVLRGDPNVIFISDDPDEGVMARILKCALTGQLVILSLHAADIGQVFQRLLDLKAPPHLLSSALSGVSAQRLVRKVCPKCAGDAKAETTELKKLGWKGKKITAREGKGCPHCNNSGFRGRAAIYEFLQPDKAFKDALQTGDMTHIRQALTKAVRRTLAAAAADLVATGVTTLAEVQRVLAG